MRTVTCWRLRQSLTRYADGESESAERDLIDRHLATCDHCRRRVRIERAVGQHLRDRTASAGTTAWLPVPDFQTRRSMTAWGGPALAAALVVALAVWIGNWSGGARVETVGVISDSHCNGVHRPAEARGGPPGACIQGCLRRGARYVFVAGDTIYTILNQERVDLVASAGRPVRVSGTAAGTQLTLARVDPLDIAR
jgi:hypothetical protein